MWASGITVSSTVSALKELESWMLVVVGVGWLVRVGVTHSVGGWAFEAWEKYSVSEWLLGGSDFLGLKRVGWGGGVGPG
jgi:hypothetical protein